MVVRRFAAPGSHIWEVVLMDPAQVQKGQHPLPRMKNDYSRSELDE